MPIIKTHDIKAGMTLVKEVQNYSGKVLLPRGTVLTEKQILTLKAWGITEADVQDNGIVANPIPEALKIDPRKLARAEKEAGALFKFSNPDHPAVAELMRLSGLNRLKKMPGMSHIDVK